MALTELHSSSLPHTVQGWLELDQKYRIKGRYDISQVLVRGKGVRVWDADDKEYIDFESGQVCTSTGHCHHLYTNAIIEQAGKLVQTGSGYTTPARILLAQKLAEIMPPGSNLSRSYFACTGSEATETAVRLAKIYTGRTEIVSLTRGYHGMTHASLAVTGLGGKFKSVPGSGLAGVIHIPAPYAYQSPFKDDTNDMAAFRQGIEIIEWTSTGKPAAIILEVVMSVAGMIIPSKQYVQAIRHWCTENGTLMIIDEAQSGVSRTGKWFAIEHFDVIPDIITTSKSLGDGVPLCGVTTTPDIADRVGELGYHQSSSHTDDPFLAAVGLANIEILEKENLVQNADVMGRFLKEQFEKMQEQHEILGDVRGLGLMIGLEIVVDKASKTPSPLHVNAISEYCRAHGLLLGHRPTGAVSGNNIRILPPLILNLEEADEALNIIRNGIAHAEMVVEAQGVDNTAWM